MYLGMLYWKNSVSYFGYLVQSNCKTAQTVYWKNFKEIKSTQTVLYFLVILSFRNVLPFIVFKANFIIDVYNDVSRY